MFDVAEDWSGAVLLLVFRLVECRLLTLRLQAHCGGFLLAQVLGGFVDVRVVVVRTSIVEGCGRVESD